MALPEEYQLPPVVIEYTQWPTPDDVVGQMIGGRYWPSDANERVYNYVSATAGLASAVSEFERLTGWEPFLADNRAVGLTEVRFFDAPDPGGYLDLSAGLLDLVSVSVHGTAYTLDQNVYLRPSNGARQNKPYTQLQFPYLPHSYIARPNVIAVTGRWGRFREVPPDVWFAILRYAQYLTLTSGNQDQDVASWSEDGFSEGLDTVGPLDPKTISPLLSKEFYAAVVRYKRVIC